MKRSVLPCEKRIFQRKTVSFYEACNNNASDRQALCKYYITNREKGKPSKVAHSTLFFSSRAKKEVTVYYADNNVGSCVFAVFSPPCKEVFVYQQ